VPAEEQPGMVGCCGSAAAIAAHEATRRPAKHEGAAGLWTPQARQLAISGHRTEVAPTERSDGRNKRHDRAMTQCVIEPACAEA